METHDRLLREVEAALRTLPGLEVRSARRERGVDLELVVEVQGRPARLLIEASVRGFPRDLREAAWRVERFHDDDHLPTHSLVAAPALSPGAREFLCQQGLGYWDMGGSLHLQLPWAVYHIDRAAPKEEVRRLREPYRGSAAQVLHALLLEPQRPWQVQGLAARAQVSPYTAHRLLTYLEDQLWVEKQGSGPETVRLLREPGALLDAWAAAHSLDRYRFWRFHRWFQSPTAQRQALAGILEGSEIAYALTLASGAQLAAPFSSSVERLAILLSSEVDIDRLAQAAELNPVDEGENVVFLATRERSPLMFRERIEDVWVASPVQLYLDLWAWPMRGKEQARHLRAERLPY